MLAMQYEITLPADYDMGIVRSRVATRGSRTDTFPGLGLKAYGIREKGVDGSTVNQYAPFYVWLTPAAMNDFLVGPGFAALCADFGRPSVRHWNGLAFALGPEREATPRAASRISTRLEPGGQLREAVAAAGRDVRRHGETPGVWCSALAIDPTTWELVQFTLWAKDVGEGAGDRYEVLHTSTPHLAALPPARGC